MNEEEPKKKEDGGGGGGKMHFKPTSPSRLSEKDIGKLEGVL